MTTARDVIVRAARRLKIIEGEEPLTAAELTDGLQLLNDMMHGFGTRGIHYAHTTLAASDTVNLPDEHLRNLVLVFCIELAIDFGVPPDAVLVSQVSEAMNALQAAYWVQPPADTEPSLRPAPRFLDITRMT